MTAERLADDYAPIMFSDVRIRRLRLRNSFCPSSSSVTPIGCPTTGCDYLQSGHPPTPRAKRLGVDCSALLGLLVMVLCGDKKSADVFMYAAEPLLRII